MSLKGIVFSFLWIASLLVTGSIFSFSLLDEMLCLFLLAFALRQGIWRSRYFVLFIAYILLHITISIVYDYNGIKPILLDALMYAKPFVCALACGSGYFVLNEKDNRVLKTIIYHLLYFLFADSFATWIFGIRDVAAKPLFWFTTNCTLAGTTTLMLLYYFFMQKKDELKIITLKKCFLYTILLLTALITMQGKYFGFVFVFFALMLFCKKMVSSIQLGNSQRRFFYKSLSLVMVVLMVMGVAYLALDDINAYYLTDNQNVARVMMVRSLPKVLDGVFFFTGRGFGAFCSPVTSLYYPAEFMNEIGLSQVYGLSESYSNLMSDGYLWSFAGCFGFIGIVLCIAFVFYMFRPLWTLWKIKKMPIKLFFSSLVCFSWIMIFSLGSGLMFGYGCFVMIIWGMLRWKAVQILKKETETT